MPVFAELISIGDEILYGQTLDTNSHWISARLDEIGVKVRRKITIGDTREEILSALAESTERADIILITGGLGPTKDDLTKPLLAEYFGVGFTRHQEVIEHLKTLFSKRGRVLTELNEQQADLPANCTMLMNKLGTAPGMWFEENDTIYVSMPGVPYEMKGLMNDHVLPRLTEKYQEVIYHKIVRTIGIPESVLAQKIEDWENNLPKHLKLAYLPSFGQVKLRLTAIGGVKSELEKEVQQQIDQLLPLIESSVFGYDEDEIEKVIGDMLLAKNQTIAFAESCTGGLISHLITSVPGSSQYFKGSVISYSNEVKIDELGVNPEVLEAKGAVSEEVVMQMAKGVRERLKTDVGVSVSGIAGPDGGTEEKPVGTVWIGYSDKQKTVAKQFNFLKDRNLNIKFSAYSALNMFRIQYQAE